MGEWIVAVHNRMVVVRCRQSFARVPPYLRVMHWVPTIDVFASYALSRKGFADAQALRLEVRRNGLVVHTAAGSPQPFSSFRPELPREILLAEPLMQQATRTKLQGRPNIQRGCLSRNFFENIDTPIPYVCNMRPETEGSTPIGG